MKVEFIGTAVKVPTTHRNIKRQSMPRQIMRGVKQVRGSASRRRVVRHAFMRGECLGECGRYMGCGNCGVNPAQFDRLSADEIVYVAENTDNPELMGAALKNLFKKATKKASQVKQKIVSKIKTAPKPLKIAAGIALAPLAPMAAPQIATAIAAKKVLKNAPKPLKAAAAVALAPIVPTIAPAILAAKTGKAVVKAPVAKRFAAAVKKAPTPLKIAAGVALAPFAPATTAALLTTSAAALPTALATAPVLAPKIAAAVAAKKFIDAKRKAEAAREKNIVAARAKQPPVHVPSAVTGKNVTEARAIDEQPTDITVDKSVSTVVPTAAKQAVENGETTTAAMQTTDSGETTEKKGIGIGTILPIAALAALPFVL